MIDKNFTYAVIGASNNTEKYGYKVFVDLLSAGYKVFPVNHKESSVADKKAYASLGDYPGSIDVVIFVVPPKVTEKILPEVFELGIKKVWMQPGSESEEAIGFCQKNGISHIENACIMLRRN